MGPEYQRADLSPLAIKAVGGLVMSGDSFHLLIALIAGILFVFILSERL